MQFRSLLIANRGEIALRIARTARRMGLRTVAVYSEADRDSRHAREMDAALCIGRAAPRESYLNIAALIAAARQSGADAVHPGYGFLAESADFAQAALDAGLAWIGPPPAAIRAMGDKGEAKRLAAAAGVPVLPEFAPGGRIEYPVMIKAAAGGGGRGMRLVRAKGELEAALAHARSEAEHAFGDGRLLLERALEEARHVEVQVFADTRGHCIHLGERDCSVQRRHQKLIEESPSPAVDAALRAKMGAAAVAAAKAAGYVGAGTVEFLLEKDRRFWFMEMNTRLQVEHPVTEMLTGIDLVEWQLRIAAGEPLPLAQDEVRFVGHAIEARLCAEDPARDFLPQAGRLVLWETPPPQPSRSNGQGTATLMEGVRVEHALESGAEIPPHYDSMIAKHIAHGATRDEARAKLAAALDDTVALGVPTNKAFLASVLRDPVFARGEATTAFLAGRSFPAAEPDDETLALAAALLAQQGNHGEWTGWSNNPSHSLRARFGGREIALVQGKMPAGWPQRGDERLRYVVEGEVVHLARGGQSWRLENTLHAPPEKRGATMVDGRLASPMNGRVVAVNARPGERIEPGAALVVLEAMKMEHGLALPAAVRVTAVHVAAGTQVAPGRLLIEFEPA